MTQKFRLYKIQIGWRISSCHNLVQSKQSKEVLFEMFMEHYCLDTLRSAVSNMLAPEYCILNVEVSNNVN